MGDREGRGQREEMGWEIEAREGGGRRWGGREGAKGGRGE